MGWTREGAKGDRARLFETILDLKTLDLPGAKRAETPAAQRIETVMGARMREAMSAAKMFPREQIRKWFLTARPASMPPPRALLSTGAESFKIWWVREDYLAPAEIEARNAAEREAIRGRSRPRSAP